MFKKAMSSLLAITIAITTLIVPAQATSSNASGSGTGGTVTNFSYWSSNYQGLRLYLVTQEGNIVGDVIDIPYTENYLATALSTDKVSLQTKFGTIDSSRWLILSNVTLSTSNIDWWDMYLSGVSTALMWTGSNYVAQGELIETQLMNTGNTDVAKIIELVGKEKSTGTIFTDPFNIANIGERPADVMVQNGYRVVVEPLFWVRPSSAEKSFASTKYYYGTPEGISTMLANDGIHNGWNGMTSFTTGSYSLSLLSDTYKNKTASTGELKPVYTVSASGVKTYTAYTNVYTAKAGAHTGNGLHIYFADIEPEGGTVDIWDNFRYETGETLDYVSSLSVMDISAIRNMLQSGISRLSTFGLSSQTITPTKLTAEDIENAIPNISIADTQALLSATNTSNLTSALSEDKNIYNHISNQLSSIDYKSASEYTDLSELENIANLVAIPIELEKAIGGLTITTNPEVYSLYELR